MYGTPEYDAWVVRTSQAIAVINAAIRSSTARQIAERRDMEMRAAEQPNAEMAPEHDGQRHS